MWSNRLVFVVVFVLVTMSSLSDAKKLYTTSEDYDYLIERGMWSLGQKMKILSPSSIFELNPRVYDTGGVYAEEVEGQESNKTCFRDLRLLQDALNNQTFWAMKMLDASSKISSGMLEGNLIDLGQYEECVNAWGIWKDVEIYGRPCMYTISFDEMNLAAAAFNPMLTICVPTTCEPEDLMVMFNQTIHTINEQIKQLNKTIGTIPFGLGVKVTSVSCSEVDGRVWDTGFIVCITIFFIYVCFLLACTFCDVKLRNLITTGTEKIVSQDHSILATLSKFSLLKNAASILSTRDKRESLPAIHGIRVISMAWIVLYHQHSTALSGVNVNMFSFMKWNESWSALYIWSGTFAVDTFLVISGFLMTYLFLKQMPKQKCFNIPVYYLRRYFRLTPTVLVLVIFSAIILPKISSEPRWGATSSLITNNCDAHWWSVILYVQNFIHLDSVCLVHLWYLAVDMQLFWISPIILYPLYRMPKLGLAILSLFIAASIAIPAAIVGYNRYPTVSSTSQPQAVKMMYGLTETYITPYCRAGPWLLGIYLGYEVATKNRKLNKCAICAGWTLCIASLALCVFGLQYFLEPNYEYQAILETFYAAISRPLWGFGVCWVIFACINDRNGPVTKFLNWKYFLPLSRLSYCTYLVHYLLQLTENASTKVPNYFSDYNFWKSYLAVLILSLIIAFFFSLLIESPLLILEDMVLRKRRKSDSESRKDVTRNGVKGSAQEEYYAS